MATSRRWWQRREEAAAAMFGAKRQPGSGSGGRKDQTRSDSTHPRLFIEAKVRAESAVRTLFDATKALAKKENKTPVLVLFSKGKVGGLVVCHQDDLQAVAAELKQDKESEPCWDD